jgi:hypothetical protein
MGLWSVSWGGARLSPRGTSAHFISTRWRMMSVEQSEEWELLGGTAVQKTGLCLRTEKKASSIIWRMPSSVMWRRVTLAPDGITSQKTAFFIVTAVKTSVGSTWRRRQSPDSKKLLFREITEWWIVSRIMILILIDHVYKPTVLNR